MVLFRLLSKLRHSIPKSLKYYLSKWREFTIVSLIVNKLSRIFSRLLGLAKFTDAFTLERIIVDCVRHNDMQITVDHRTRTVHFGSDMTGAQSYNAMEGPHLQDMPSEQIRQQLMQMLEVLDKSLKTIHPDKIKIDNNALRQKIGKIFNFLINFQLFVHFVKLNFSRLFTF